MNKPKVPAILQKPGPISSADKSTLKARLIDLGKKLDRTPGRPVGTKNGGSKRSKK